MQKASYVLAERFSQDQLDTVASNILLEFAKIKYPSMNLVMTSLFETKKYSSQQQQAMQEIKTKFLKQIQNQSNVGKKTKKTIFAIFKSFEEPSDT